MVLSGVVARQHGGKVKAMHHLKAESFNIPDLRHTVSAVLQDFHLIQSCAAVSLGSTHSEEHGRTLLHREGTRGRYRKGI